MTKYSQRRVTGLMRTPLMLPSDSESSVHTLKSDRYPAGHLTFAASRYRSSAISPVGFPATGRLLPAISSNLNASRGEAGHDVFSQLFPALPTGNTTLRLGLHWRGRVRRLQG